MGEEGKEARMGREERIKMNGEGRDEGGGNEEGEDQRGCGEKEEGKEKRLDAKKRWKGRCGGRNRE